MTWSGKLRCATGKCIGIHTIHRIRLTPRKRKISKVELDETTISDEN